MRNNNVIEQELLDAGYKKSVSPHYEFLKMTDTLYQKRVSDALGIKFYINAWLFPERVMPNGLTCPEGIMIETQFWERNSDDDTVDVTLSTNDIEKAERDLEDIWRKMKYGYKELWGE